MKMKMLGPFILVVSTTQDKTVSNFSSKLVATANTNFILIKV